MSDRQHGSGEQRAPESDGPPRTGVPQVDEALAELSGLEVASLAEQHGRLARAHAALTEALSGPGAGAAEGPGGRDDPPRP